MTHTRTLLLSAVAGLALSATATLAALNTGDTLPTAEADLRSALEAQGYTVMSIEIEGDEIEVEATSTAGPVEFELSAATGVISEIETGEDADHDDDDTEDTDGGEEDGDDDK